MASVARGVAVLGGMMALGAVLAVTLQGVKMTPEAVAVEPAAGPKAAAAEDTSIAQLRRGAYLMSITGCGDCHTPRNEKGEPDARYYLAGHPADAPLPAWDPSMLKQHTLMTMDPTGTAFAGPWGVSVAPNITPDKDTGIGSMTAEQLIKSWRTGTHWKVNRPILPPMPSPSYAAMTDDDIRAVHAFLMSLPPVKNAAPASVVAPPPPASTPASSPSAPAAK